MKTSKIIFLSLLGTIAVFILASLVDVRINGRRNGDIQSDFKVNRHALHSFSVLYVNNSMNVSLVQNDSSFIEVTYPKDSLAPKVNYTIKEDTLKVTDFEKLNHQNVSVKIHSADSLKKVLLKNSDISIEHLDPGKMYLDMDQSSVWFNLDKSKKSSLYQALDIVARNHSRINSTEYMVDSLGLALHNSEANLEIIAKKISGTLADSSKIYARNPSEISLKKDATSKINVNDY
jgi:hypothetical protein